MGDGMRNRLMQKVDSVTDQGVLAASHREPWQHLVDLREAVPETGRVMDVLRDHQVGG